MDFKDLTPIEQEGQRVLTSEQLAEMYGITPKRISDNFKANAGNFTEGVDFFLLKGKLLKDYKSQPKKLPFTF